MIFFFLFFYFIYFYFFYFFWIHFIVTEGLALCSTLQASWSISKGPCSSNQCLLQLQGHTVHFAPPLSGVKVSQWWASSSDMLIYPSIFAFPLLSLHHRSSTMHLRSDATMLTLAWQSHSLNWTDLAYLMDTWLTIHMYLLLFLVSPMCPLLRSDQSQALTPCSQALSITLPYAHFLVCHLYLTCLYLPFPQNIITKAPTNCLYQSPSELRFSTYASHHLTLISHYFTLHCTATIPLSLLATMHLETIPYPQITPPQSLIGFILRSPAP